MPGADFFFASVSEISAKLRAKEVSAVELAREFALRLEKLGPRYNALALPLTEQAIRRAREIDKDIQRGRFRSPLQGIPYGAKDLLAYPGQPTTWGARPYAAQVFDYAATAVAKLDRAGAVLAGKLSMVELAGGPSYRYPAASMFGPGLNPWDRSRWSGGSSSGSGSAVAAGLVPFALGSETSGSILTPAAFCGITGLRPTYGLVSRYGAMALSWTLDKIGPMCRTAEDCALVLQAMAGADSKDPGSAGKSFYYTPKFQRNFADLKAGFSPGDLAGVEPAARPVFEQAMAVIRDIGIQATEARLPAHPYGPVVGTIVAAEGSSIFEPLVASGKVDELADAKQIAGLKAGLEIPAKDYLKAMRIRTLIQQDFARLFATLDVLVAPTRTGIAPKITEPLDRRSGPERPTPEQQGLTALIPAGNLAGLPALSLPCGFAEKMPVAIQLVGPPFSENTLIALGKEFQARTDWHKRRPPE